MTDPRGAFLRRKAEQCMQLAQSATHPAEREKFLALAEAWHEMADQVEETHTMKSSE
jgi:uncharacterized protein Yka (UPF0111/DUF47 family)